MLTQKYYDNKTIERFEIIWKKKQLKSHESMFWQCEIEEKPKFSPHCATNIVWYIFQNASIFD